MFKTKYGYFSSNGKEFIITNPQTPRPWVNVISNGDMGFILSQAGGGYSWRTNAQINRLTRWEQDIVKDEWGKFLYIRDAQIGKLWSAAWKPCCVTPDFYEVHYGAGYATILSRLNGIQTAWTMFVAPDEPIELWKLIVTNTSKKNRTLQLFTFFEWCLGAAPDWHREFHKCFIETQYDSSMNAILATKRLWEVPSGQGHWNVAWPYIAFHSVNIKPAAFDCSKENVLGPYGTPSRPLGITSGRLKKASGNYHDPVASLHVNVALAPGQSKTLIFTLGASANRDEVRALTKKYRSIPNVDAALEKVQQRWNTLLSASQVKTPDASMNILLNHWLKYQAIAGRLWGRTGYYQAGGAYGYRDQLQDSQIFLSVQPERTKEQILLHARHQFKDGTVYHWWHPLSEVGYSTAMTDDLLWLPFLVNSYWEETGDSSILDCKEPFVDDHEPSSLYDHCFRAIEKTLCRVSPRGLPLIGAGDWNDGLSAVGLKWKGESIWLGEFLYYILKRFVRITAIYGDAARSEQYLREAEKLIYAINQYGWDGHWYFYGTKDSGEKIGSQENKEGRIHLNPQTWAILADIADGPRASEVLDVIFKNLESEAGPILLSPAYHTPDEYIGYLTRYAPGTRENGATYTHAATWAIIAAAKLGEAEAAYRLFSKINPIVRGSKPDHYCVEPYVSPGNIDGPDSEFYGRGGWTWYTGSAAWLWKSGMEWILGVRATPEGLLIKPCIPAQWKEYSVKRIFRGATYRIAVSNPNRVNRGIVTVLADGQPLEGFQPADEVVLPLYPPSSNHEITVVLGKE
ncbi:MAG: glycosyl transferase family 36 [bacterium]